MKVIINRRFDILFYGIASIIFLMLVELWIRQYSELSTTILTVGVLSLVIAIIAMVKKITLLFLLPIAFMLALIILLIGFPNYVSFTGIIFSAIYLFFLVFSIVISLKKKSKQQE